MKQLLGITLLFLILISTSYSQQNPTFSVTKFIPLEHVSVNVWDTNIVNTNSGIPKNIRIECLMGSVIISLSQNDAATRDTTVSYDSIGVGGYIEYAGATCKVFYIKAIGDSAKYKASLYYGNSYGIRRGAMGSAIQATVNLYGYAYKDSANTFTEVNEFDSTATFNQSITLPAFTDYGTHDLGNGQGWDTTANVYCGQIEYVNSASDLINTAAAQTIAITSDKVTANSKIVVIIESFDGDYIGHGTPIIGNVRPRSGSFTYQLINIDGITAIPQYRGITIRWWIIN